MSFSSEVKEELAKHEEEARHCQIAEIAAVISFCGRLESRPAGGERLTVHTENASVARKYFTLLKKTFKINTEIDVRRNQYLHKSNVYTIAVGEQSDIHKVLTAVKMLPDHAKTESIVTQRTCCKRAYIRGAFLASGSISDPEKFYHFEIVCPSRDKAEQLSEMFRPFHLDAKIVLRKKNYVVYLKEGAQIVDVLGVMDASLALMRLENIRILKDMRNAVNRQVNCETANLNKTVSAAVGQIQDIRYIQETVGFSELSEGLEEIACLRLEYPDKSLKELGEMLSPPVGKSGVNHRLRKLSELAEELRGTAEDQDC